MIEIVKEIQHGKKLLDGSELKAQICLDPYPENPRELSDPISHIACLKHPRYILGDEQVDADEWEDFLSEVMPTAVAFLPLYLFDHSGLRISTRPFSCKWDSFQIGYVFLFPEKLQEFGIELDANTEEGKEKARQILENEVKEYDRYLSGEVYDLRLFHKGEHLFSIGNFVDDLDYVELCAKEEMEDEYERLSKIMQKEIDEKNYWAARDVVTA